MIAQGVYDLAIPDVTAVALANHAFEFVLQALKASDFEFDRG